MKSVIYETKGRAREFCELAANLYSGCGHRCIYCYGAKVTHQDRQKFDFEPKARVNPGDIQCSAMAWAQKGETRPVLLCFVTDPYQPLDIDTRLTRMAIEILTSCKLPVTVLTKGGRRAIRDFDMLANGNNAFATTLTCTDEGMSKRWEPGAAPPLERIASLEMAYKLGIETWVSLEPVIDPWAVPKLIAVTKDFVGHYKVGTLNYDPYGQTIDWHTFGWSIKKYMDELGVRYYLKEDLRRAMKYTGPAWSNGGAK